MASAAVCFLFSRLHTLSSFHAGLLHRWPIWQWCGAEAAWGGDGGRDGVVEVRGGDAQRVGQGSQRLSGTPPPQQPVPRSCAGCRRSRESCGGVALAGVRQQVRWAGGWQGGRCPEDEPWISLVGLAALFMNIRPINSAPSTQPHQPHTPTRLAVRNTWHHPRALATTCIPLLSTVCTCGPELSRPLHHMHQDGSAHRCRQEAGEAQGRGPAGAAAPWQQPPHQLPCLCT